MAIPIFFSPKFVDGVNTYDGGTRNNFPLELFMKTYPQNTIIGLYLRPSEKSNRTSFKQKCKKVILNSAKFIIPGLKKGTAAIGDIVDIVIDGEEMQTVEDNLDKVVIIDPSPIQTTDFKLNEKKKELLILAGRLGALKFIDKNHKDILLDKATIIQLTEKIEQLRKEL